MFLFEHHLCELLEVWECMRIVLLKSVTYIHMGYMGMTSFTVDQRDLGM